MRQGGRPYDIQNDINALCRPVSNRSTYVFGLLINYTFCAQASDIRHIVSAASRCHQQTSALHKLHREAANTTRGSVYEHLSARYHTALLRMEQSLEGGQRRNGNSGCLSEA